MLGKLFLFLISGFLAAYVANMLLHMGSNKRVYNHRPGHCEEIEGIKHGSEDIVVIESLGLAFISSGLFYMQERAKEVTGQIFVYNLSQSIKKAKPLPIKGFANLASFAPHGMSHFESDGVLRLFVVNHETPSFAHSIEIFRYDSQKNELIHEKTVKDEKFIRPNDVVAISADSFIVSNDGSAQTPLSNLFEVLLFLKAGSVVFYDGKESHYILENAVSPNGIIMDQSKKYLLVSHPNAKSIVVYKFGKDYKNTLEVVQEVELKTTADNLFIDPSGSVWTGAHPVLKDAFGHMGNPDDLKEYAPSQILRIDFSKDWKSWEITEVYVDDGRQLSASSSAVLYKDQLLLGTVFRQLVHCHISDRKTLQARS